jgi:hypothetical protein
MEHAPDGDDIGGTFGAIGGAVQRFGSRLSARVGARPVFESESRLFNGLRRHFRSNRDAAGRLAYTMMVWFSAILNLFIRLG